jgi:hypothetical protein
MGVIKKPHHHARRSAARCKRQTRSHDHASGVTSARPPVNSGVTWRRGYCLPARRSGPGRVSAVLTRRAGRCARACCGTIDSRDGGQRPARAGAGNRLVKPRGLLVVIGDQGVELGACSLGLARSGRRARPVRGPVRGGSATGGARDGIAWGPARSPDPRCNRTPCSAQSRSADDHQDVSFRIAQPEQRGHWIAHSATSGSTSTPAALSPRGRHRCPH